MQPIKINCNFDTVNEFFPVEKENSILQTIRQVFKTAKLMDGQEHCVEVKLFTVEATLNGKVHRILSSHSNIYSFELVSAISDKILYLTSSKFTLNAEQFEFVRRIEKNNWQSIVTLLDDDQLMDLTEGELVDFKLGNWNAPIFKREHWQALAFRAYFRGQIDQERISTLFIYNACKSGFKEFKTYQLFDGEGKVNEDALDIFTKSTTPWLTDEERAEALEILKQLSPENTQFFCGTHLPDMEFTNKILFQAAYTNKVPFGFIAQEGDQKAKAPAFDVIFQPEFTYKLFNMKGKGNALRPNRVCGYSMKEDFLKNGVRDLYIPCVYVPTPFVHNMASKDIEVYIHDIGHLLSVLYITDRDYWHKVAAILEKNGFLDAQNRVLDLSFGSYVLHRDDLKKARAGAAERILIRSNGGVELNFLLRIFKEAELLDKLMCDYPVLAVMKLFHYYEHLDSEFQDMLIKRYWSSFLVGTKVPAEKVLAKGTPPGEILKEAITSLWDEEEKFLKYLELTKDALTQEHIDYAKEREWNGKMVAKMEGLLKVRI